MKRWESNSPRKLKKGKSDERIPTPPSRRLFGHYRHTDPGRVDHVDAIHRQSDTVSIVCRCGDPTRENELRCKTIPTSRPYVGEMLVCCYLVNKAFSIYNYNNPLVVKKAVATSLTAWGIDSPLLCFVVTWFCKVMLTSVVRNGASLLSAVAIPGSLCNTESRTIGAGWNSGNPCLSSCKKMKPCVVTDPSVV